MKIENLIDSFATLNNCSKECASIMIDAYLSVAQRDPQDFSSEVLLTYIFYCQGDIELARAKAFAQDYLSVSDVEIVVDKTLGEFFIKLF